MDKKFLLLLLLTCGCFSSFSQDYNQDNTNNPNFDFSSGNFTNWNLSWAYLLSDSWTSGTDGPDSHIIVDNYGSNWDANAGIGNLQRVPNGLKRVARLGKPSGNGYGEPAKYRMSYSINVNAAYPVLMFSIASVMDETHQNSQNTHYKFSIQTPAGSFIPNQPCTGVELFPAGSGNTNSNSAPAINYRLYENPTGTYQYQKWESVAVDLSSYIDQAVVLEFQHYDCYRGYHGSYTYLSAAMRKSIDTFYYCQGASSVTVNPYIPRFKSYLWNTGDTTDSIVVNSPVNGALYTCTVGSYNGCNATLKYRLVQINTTADFSISGGATCRELQFTDMSYTTKGTIISRNWNFGDSASGIANVSSTANPIHTFSAAGTYTVNLTITTSEGCSSTVQKTLTVQEAEVFAGFTSTLTGQCKQMAFADTSQTTIGTVISWEWNFGDAVSGENNTATTHTPVHTFSEPGAYTVTLLVRTSIGCSKLVSQTVTIPSIAAADFSAADGCAGHSLYFSAADPALKSRLWNFGDGTTDSGITMSHAYNAAGSYHVTLLYTDTNSCIGSIGKTITVFPLPEISIKARPLAVPVTEPVISFEGKPNGMTSYLWQFGDGETDATQLPQHVYPAQVEAYNVILYVTDPNGCRDSATIQIQVMPQDIFMPSAFTPNGDGRNDVFGIINITTQRLLDFSVYNRYGERIFRTLDPATGWDGTFAGQICDMGTYYYAVLLGLADGSEKLIKGDVTLIR